MLSGPPFPPFANGDNRRPVLLGLLGQGAEVGQGLALYTMAECLAVAV